MREALTVLQRLRNHRKKGAEQVFAAAEQRRRQCEERVETLEAHVAENRDSNAAFDDDEACWVAQAQAWRLKMELAIRRERGRLAIHTKEVGDRQQALAKASRDTRVVEKVIEKIDDRQARADRRSEGRRLDGMGARRWYRKDG